MRHGPRRYRGSRSSPPVHGAKPTLGLRYRGVIVDRELQIRLLYDGLVHARRCSSAGRSDVCGTLAPEDEVTTIEVPIRIKMEWSRLCNLVR